MSDDDELEAWEYIRTQPAAPPAEQSPPPALMIFHDGGAQVVPLAASARFVIGRGTEAFISIQDQALSRQHASIELVGHEVWIEDLKSLNGVYVNGSRIKRASLAPGDDVILGNVHLSLLTQANFVQGFEHHLRFVQKLQEELKRSQAFGHQLALLLAQPANRKEARHINHWGPLVRQVLRPFDTIGFQGAGVIEILMPETSYQQAMYQAQRVAAAGCPLRCGIAFYPGNPVEAPRLLELAERALARATDGSPIVADEGQACVAAVEPHAAELELVPSRAMKQVLESIERVASTRIPVLIVGETGVGKEVVAQAIHRAGPRAERAMKFLNCGLISRDLAQSILFGHERGSFTGAVQLQRGVFEEADGSTLLLDEVGELSLEAQVALLRVLETGRITRLGSSRELEVDTRVISATHRNLESMCEANGFRWDLFYRLNSVTIEIPPLRARADELRPLCEYFVRRVSAQSGLPSRPIDPAVFEVLQRYSFPGNIRELRNAMERAVVVSRGKTIAVADLPEKIVRELDRRSDDSTTALRPLTQEEAGIIHEELAQQAEPSAAPAVTDFRETQRGFERALLLRALDQAGWNKTDAARLLQMPLRTLMHRIRFLDLSPGHAPPRLELPATRDYRAAMRQFEKDSLEAALARARGNKTEAARLLGLPLNTFLYKLKNV